jgi:hypothetical protein
MSARTTNITEVGRVSVISTSAPDGLVRRDRPSSLFRSGRNKETPRLEAGSLTHAGCSVHVAFDLVDPFWLL